MDANKEYPETKNLTYSEFLSNFLWNDEKRKWFPRKSGSTIGRLHFVPPGSGEIYYFGTLLNYVKGAKSYEDIKKVNNFVHPNFKDNCYAMGLIEGDKEYIDVLIAKVVCDIVIVGSFFYQRIKMQRQLSRLEVMWAATWVYLSGDILYRQRKILQFLGFHALSSSIFSFLIILYCYFTFNL